MATLMVARTEKAAILGSLRTCMSFSQNRLLCAAPIPPRDFIPSNFVLAMKIVRFKNRQREAGERGWWRENERERSRKSETKRERERERTREQQ
jgi:hypothetical protein